MCLVFSIWMVCAGYWEVQRQFYHMQEYMLFYVLLSAPAMATGCVMNNILRYEGYASLAMIGLVSGGVLNMVGDAFFMFGLHMGVRGLCFIDYDFTVYIFWYFTVFFVVR